MSDKYYYRVHGQEFGPVSREMITRWIFQQVLVAGDTCRVSHGTWRDVTGFIAPSSTMRPPETSAVSSGEPMVASSSLFRQAEPWVYLSHSGVHGPLSTGLFLDAVRKGHVQPKTMIRLHPSPGWFTAESIDGLEFPVPRVTRVLNSQILTSAAEYDRTPPNAEIRLLFAECVSRQRKNMSAHPTRASTKARTNPITHWSGPMETLSAAVTKLMDLTVAIGLRLSRSQRLWMLVVVVCLSLIYLRVAPSLVTQEQVYSTLLETHAEMTRRRNQTSDEAEWTEFQTRTLGELAELVPVLERRAVADDKTSMSLLWLARDYLPRLLKASPPNGSVDESQVQEHFRIVDQEFRLPRRSMSHGDWWIRAIVGLDVVGVLALLACWVRKRLAD